MSRFGAVLQSSEKSSHRKSRHSSLRSIRKLINLLKLLAIAAVEPQYLDKGMTGRTYNLTTWLWPEDGVIEVFDVADKRIATFSCQFLKLGRVFNWDYIIFACQCVVNEAGSLYHLSSQSGGRDYPALNCSTTPLAGRYLYLSQENASTGCSFAKGPRFQLARRGPSAKENSSGTMSHSSRSTAQQTEFRNALYIRDGFCLLTDQPPGQAAHILPQSRPEYYREVLGYDPVNYHNVSFGLLLKSDLHHSFDRGDWALYPSPQDPRLLIVHVFNDELSTALHGKLIPVSRFRVLHERELPNANLLLFHYRQCLIKHIRGFEFFDSN